MDYSIYKDINVGTDWFVELDICPVSNFVSSEGYFFDWASVTNTSNNTATFGLSYPENSTYGKYIRVNNKFYQNNTNNPLILELNEMLSQRWLDGTFKKVRCGIEPNGDGTSNSWVEAFGTKVYSPKTITTYHISNEIPWGQSGLFIGHTPVVGYSKITYKIRSFKIYKRI